MNKYKGTHFAPRVVDIFIPLAERDALWHELADGAISKKLMLNTPEFFFEYSYEEIRNITKTFSKIINAKSSYTQLHSSGLAEKTEKMAKFYAFDEEITQQLLIAADLHDLGKMAVSNKILDKPGILTAKEFGEIKIHPGVGKACLDGIKGFELIVQLIFQHHEKLDGSGYPQGLIGEKLDFKSRLLTCLDIYQALTEERPYRKGMNHKAAAKVLKDMAEKNLIDAQIVNDIIQFLQP
ncbi:MAG: HD domain-containing protein [Spirochaetes bacterium]|nr:HD domain-containing protein [Spirochaetota bacterium]